MIISVDPSTAEDIATFAMVKQYTLQPTQITLEVTGWTADAEYGGYTKTKSQGIIGSLVTFTDPSAIVSYNITNGDTSNYDIASLAGIQLDSIVAGQTSYTFTFRADELPTDNTVIDVLVYGTQIVGGGSSGDPTSADEITAAAIAALNANKLDKRTTTGAFAYTHNGDTQGEISIEDGQSANTIPIRDANGRMHAADPASGATDRALVTANWVSQSGNSAPNNLVHRNGNETIYDRKTYDSLIIGRNVGDRIGNAGGILLNDHTSIIEMLTIKLPYLYGVEFTLRGGANNQNYMKAEYVLIRSRSGTEPALYCLSKKASGNNQLPKLYFTYTNTDEFTIYGVKTQYCYQYCNVTNYLYYGEDINKPLYRMALSPNTGTIVPLPADAVEEVIL